MAITVQIDFEDNFNTITKRKYTSDKATLALVKTDLDAFALAYADIGNGGIDKVIISEEYVPAGAPSPGTGSNVDENLSAKVAAADGFNYDMNIPMPIPALFNPDRTLITTDADVVTFFAQFLAAGGFEINLRAPTAITQLVGGLLDK